MGAALVGGLLAAGRPPSSIAVTEVAAGAARAAGRDAARRARVRRRGDVRRGGARGQAGATSPRRRGAAVAAGARRLLSIAAGITIAHIEQAIDGVADEAVAVVRAMPNTPALVGPGASAIAARCRGRRRRPGVGRGDPRRRRAGGARRRERNSTRSPRSAAPGPAYLFFVAEALIGGRRGGRPGTRARRDADHAVARRLGDAARVARRPGRACAPRSRHPAARPRPGSPCSSRAACRRSSKRPCARPPPASRELAAG